MPRFLSLAAVIAVASATMSRDTSATSHSGQADNRRRDRVAADTGTRVRSLDSTIAIATFDSAWRTVGASLAGRNVTTLDWPAVGRELRPRAARAASDSALRVVLDDMLRRIGESHFAIIPAEASAPSSGPAGADAVGTAGLAVRIVDRRLVAWRIDSAGPAQRAGVAPGWIIERIDGFAPPALGPADSVSTKRIAVLTGAMRSLRGAPGTAARVVARDITGARREITITREAIRGPVTRFGNLPPLPATFDLTQRTLADGRCVAVAHFEYWMPPVMPALDRAVDSARACAGIVVDLRGNLGGVAAMMMGAAGHFLTEPKTLGIMRTRGEEMRFVANPRLATDAGVPVKPFAGDVAILIDGLSASTSEMFAAALQGLGRARVFGERSAGQALPAIATRLPNGDVLMHVVADFVAADGSRVEGKGVVPDEVVRLTHADLDAGRDAPLEAALRWMERPRPASR